jgi:hypothetical protein
LEETIFVRDQIPVFSRYATAARIASDPPLILVIVTGIPPPVTPPHIASVTEGELQALIDRDIPDIIGMTTTRPFALAPSATVAEIITEYPELVAVYAGLEE